MSNFETGYNFEPGDTIWVVNQTQQSIHKGTCTQVDIKIYKDSAGLSPVPDDPPIVTHLHYWTQLDNQVGSVRVNPEDAFETLEEALAALSADIMASPTPTPTPSITPTISITPSNTPTPSVTPTVTPTPSHV